MKKLLISVAATALFALPVLAQPDHHEGSHGGGSAPQAHGGPAGGNPHPQPGPSMHQGPQGGNSGRPMTGTPGYSRGANGGGFNHPAPGSNRAYARGPNGGANAHPGPGRNPRHDFHGFVGFHQNFNATRHFHAGAYRRPPGWYSHHWVFGEFLPVSFWAPSYWLNDYMAYALAPPPYGAVWVRVGDDALLVDRVSGEIITVEYGVFD